MEKSKYEQDEFNEVDTGRYTSDDENDENEEIDEKLSYPTNSYNPKEVLSELISKNNLKYNNKSYSVDWLVDRLGKGKYRMPAYQRRYVWSEDQVTALIVSLLKQLPIPRLYGYYIEEEEGEQFTLIIDGQQRLTSLFMYRWGIFPKFKKRMDYATKLKEIAEHCKIYYSDSSSKIQKSNSKRKLEKTYQLEVDHEFFYLANEIDEEQHRINISYQGKSDLTEQQKYRLLDRELEFLIVSGEDFSEAVDLFRIYNSSGTPLNTQEIRNGIYQNNYLYKKINDYSDNILNKDGDCYDLNHNWFKFNRNYIAGDRMEIKRLFQLLSYYFAFSYESQRLESCNYKFEKRDSPLLRFLKDKRKEGLSDQEFNIYLRHYRKKGSLEKMINNYSQFIAENGKLTEVLDKEFITIKSFFKLKFSEKQNGKRFNYNNLCMIYLVLRANDKLETKKTIPAEAIYYDCKGLKLDPEGFLKRIQEIRDVLIREGIV